jgi:peptide/nickel transport system permease protein
MDSLTPPFLWKEEVPLLLGTDVQGRDILSRLISGARVSIEISFLAVFISGGIGITWL